MRERLSRYVRVVGEASRLGRERITSSELGAQTQTDASQVRRDLSRFSRVGRRGVGYEVEPLQGELRKLLLGTREFKLALVGAGRLGQAIASSPLFAAYGLTIRAIVDTDARTVGRRLGGLTVSDPAELPRLVREQRIVAGLLAVPAASAQEAADGLVRAGVETVLNYSEALVVLPAEVTLLSCDPAAQLIASLSSRRG